MTDVNETGSPLTRDAPQRINELLDRIITKHHDFTRSAVRDIVELIKSTSRQGENSPDRLSLREAITILANDLLAHLQKEEAVLFPYIKHLSASVSDGSPASRPVFGSVANPIRMMRLEHEESDNVLKRIRSLTDNYAPPKGASPELENLYRTLKELEVDLREHIHLEDELLFPTAARLEQELFRQ